MAAAAAGQQQQQQPQPPLVAPLNAFLPPAPINPLLLGLRPPPPMAFPQAAPNRPPMPMPVWPPAAAGGLLPLLPQQMPVGGGLNQDPLRLLEANKQLIDSLPSLDELRQLGLLPPAEAGPPQPPTSN